MDRVSPLESGLVRSAQAEKDTRWPLWICSAVEVDLGIVSHYCVDVRSKALTPCLQLCVSVPAIRPLLAIYLPRLLESSRPPVRQIKDCYDDSNEISNKSASTQAKGSAWKGSSGYFSKDPSQSSVSTKDLERGDSLEHVAVGNTTYRMEYTDVQIKSEK